MRLISVICLLMLCTSAGLCNNVVNGGFEEGFARSNPSFGLPSEEVASGWRLHFSAWAQGGAWDCTTDVKSGGHSQKLRVEAEYEDFACVNQTLNVTANQWYTFSAWVKPESGSACVSVSYDADGYWGDFHQPVYVIVPASSEWCLVSQTFYMPVNKLDIYMFCEVGISQDLLLPGVLYIDDVSLTPVPEPSTIFALLCGIGGLGGVMWRAKSV